MTRFNRILITGAAGRLGSQLRTGLAPLAKTLRLHDIAEIPDPQAHEEVFISALGDYDAMMELTRDVDAIVHFGGASTEQKFEVILDSNIRGGYHIYEGARINGVKRVVFASSVHAIGFHELEAHIDANSPGRPDCLYGVSKCFVEDLSRLYWDKYGIESLCLRIFSSFEKPGDRRHLWSYLSFDDLVQYVTRALLAPRLGHTIGFGMSDNLVKPVDDGKAGHLGYAPEDSSEPWRAEIEAATEIPDPKSPDVKFLGGFYCSLAHPDDAD